MGLLHRFRFFHLVGILFCASFPLSAQPLNSQHETVRGLVSESTTEAYTARDNLMAMPADEATKILSSGLALKQYWTDTNRRRMAYEILAAKHPKKDNDWQQIMISGLVDNEIQDIAYGALREGTSETMTGLCERLADASLDKNRPYIVRRKILQVMPSLKDQVPDAVIKLSSLLADSSDTQSLRSMAMLAVSKIAGATELFALRTGLDPLGQILILCTLTGVCAESNGSYYFSDASARDAFQAQVLDCLAEQVGSSSDEGRLMLVEILPTLFGNRWLVENEKDEWSIAPEFLSIASRMASEDPDATVRARAKALEQHVRSTMEDKAKMAKLGQKQERNRRAMLEEMDRLRSERAGSDATDGKK